jgi:hypothetical protein
MPKTFEVVTRRLKLLRFVRMPAGTSLIMYCPARNRSHATSIDALFRRPPSRGPGRPLSFINAIVTWGSGNPEWAPNLHSGPERLHRLAAFPPTPLRTNPHRPQKLLDFRLGHFSHTGHPPQTRMRHGRSRRNKSVSRTKRL